MIFVVEKVILRGVLLVFGAEIGIVRQIVPCSDVAEKTGSYDGAVFADRFINVLRFVDDEAGDCVETYDMIAVDVVSRG